MGLPDFIPVTQPALVDLYILCFNAAQKGGLKSELNESTVAWVTEGERSSMNLVRKK